MAIYDVDRIPLGSTRTLTSAIDQLVIRKSYPHASNFSKTICVTNLDDTNELFISFNPSAVANDEEYTVAPWVSVNIDVSRSSAFDVFVRGTSWSKYSYLIV